jgi:acyl-phosphate glycerol 3-phosphate acyltransferase
MTLKIIIALVIAYALGNINPAIIIGKLYHVDIRKEGSGNPGMTNTIRVIGLKAGIAVFVVDILKAFIAVKIGLLIAGPYGAMAGFAGVVLGHCFPAMYQFKGGKGVAASLGAALALNWVSALLALGVAIVLLLITRRMSVGSMSAAVSYPFLIHHFAPEYFWFSVCAGIFLLIMHRQNIIRLLKGEEPPLSLGHRSKDPDEDTEQKKPDIQNALTKDMNDK